MDSASAKKAAEAALDKGDYSYCIKIVESFLIPFPAETATGAEFRLLKVTAHMGIGDEKEAIAICKSLIDNKEMAIRQHAKQLLSILDAPSLPRPSNWSVEIPKIEIDSSIKSSLKKAKEKPKRNNFPPTGPTKNLDFGFSIISLMIILLITFVLSGCVNISTNLHITGADRLNISLDIDSNSGKLIPWQSEFESNIKKEQIILKAKKKEFNQHFESSTISFEEINELLKQITSAASKTSGFKINEPEISVNNKNWIIGTRQNLNFYFDLSEVPTIPGLKINIILNDIHNKNNLKTKPLKPIFKNDFISLPLQIGQPNQLEVSYWKWNKIPAGIFLTIFITSLSIFLQKFRLKMGFGFPELPP